MCRLAIIVTRVERAATFIILSSLVLPLIVGCSNGGGPKLSDFSEHVVSLSDNVITFSLPARGFAPAPFVNKVEESFDIYDDSLYTRSGYFDVAVANYDWKPFIQVNGSLTVTVEVKRRVASAEHHEASLSEIVSTEDRQAGDVKHREWAAKYPIRIKDTVRFAEDGPRFLRYDYGEYEGQMDQGEDFAYPLDDSHILRFRFRFTDSSGDEPERKQWYAEAEQIADQIMASVKIDTGSVESPLDYGAPDHGLAVGRIRYRENLSSRNDPWSPK